MAKSDPESIRKSREEREQGTENWGIAAACFSLGLLGVLGFYYAQGRFDEAPRGRPAAAPTVGSEPLRAPGGGRASNTGPLPGRQEPRAVQ